MRCVSDKSCGKNENTHSMRCNLFSENRAVYEIMWKKDRRAGQATDGNMAHARILDT